MKTSTGEAGNAALPPGLLSLQLLAVFIAGAILYGHTLTVPWYLDDNFFTSDVDSNNLRQAFFNVFTQRGLSRLTFALNYWADGLNPTGYHLVNIAIHLAASGFVLLLLLRVFPRHRWYPFLGALLFVAHPLQTQAVTYTVQRMTSLAALLFLLALHLFVRARELLAAGALFRSPRHLVCYLSALLAGALAIFAKENAVLLPFALLLFARFFLPAAHTRWRPLLSYTAPFCLAPVIFGFYLAIPLLTGDNTLDKMVTPVELSNMAGNSPLRYLVTEFSVLWIYIRMLFLPYGQALDHGYPVSVELVTFKSVAGLLGLSALLILAVRLRHRQPAIAAGILWFFLTLVIESSVIPLDPLFEHRLYLPVFGFAMLVPALIEYVPRPALRYGTLVVFLLVLALLAWRRNALWNEPMAFHADNLLKSPHNERVINNYKREVELDEGIKAYRKALRENPHSAELHNNLGIFLFRRCKLEDATGEFRRALEIDPALVDAHINLGNALDIQGRTEEALIQYRKGLQIDSTASLHFNLAIALEKTGDRETAIQHYREALRLQPDNAQARQRLEKLVADVP